MRFGGAVRMLGANSDPAEILLFGSRASTHPGPEIRDAG
jgi:hypothetical protein